MTFVNRCINPSCPGLPELIKILGGQICPTIEFFSNMVENTFFKVCHSLYYIKIIIVKVGCEKEKLSKKITTENP